MPKVNLNRDAPLNDAAKRFYHFVRSGMSKKQICKLMGYSAATDVNRMHDPELFTLRELRVLYREAKLPDEEFMKMIRRGKRYDSERTFEHPQASYTIGSVPEKR